MQQSVASIGPTKIDPDWPIAEVFIYESDYDDECRRIK